MYEDNEEAKALGENPQGSHRSKLVVALSFFAGAYEVGAVVNSQCSLGGTTCRHPYEASRALGVPEAP